MVLAVCSAAGSGLQPVLSWLPGLAVSPPGPASSFRVLGGREGGPGGGGLTSDSNLGCLVIGLPWDPEAETRIQVNYAIVSLLV